MGAIAQQILIFHHLTCPCQAGFATVVTQPTQPKTLIKILSTKTRQKMFLSCIPGIIKWLTKGGAKYIFLFYPHNPMARKLFIYISFYFYTSFLPIQGEGSRFLSECKKYKCGTTCLTRYTQITSAAKHASQDIHKIQVTQNLPHRIYTNYKCCTTCYTGSTQITSGICPPQPKGSW